MSTFDFVTDRVTDSFLNEVKDLMMTFGPLSEERAVELIGRFFRPHFAELWDLELFRETPYHYAMVILHHPVLGDNLPEWYLDARFWPPPEWIWRTYYDHLADPPR